MDDNTANYEKLKKNLNEVITELKSINDNNKTIKEKLKSSLVTNDEVYENENISEIREDLKETRQNLKSLISNM